MCLRLNNTRQRHVTKDPELQLIKRGPAGLFLYISDRNNFCGDSLDLSH